MLVAEGWLVAFIGADPSTFLWRFAWRRGEPGSFAHMARQGNDGPGARRAC